MNNDDQTTFESWNEQHDSLYEAVCESIKAHHSDGMTLLQIIDVLDVIQWSMKDAESGLNS